MKRLWSAALAGLLFLDPETAHEASLRALEIGLYPHQSEPDDPRLRQSLFGLSFPNPVGVAAGYDKEARVYKALFDMGFGFAEAGTITPKPQSGNQRPRVFRLMREHGIINRFGFNSAGHAAALARLAARPPRGILGVNIGANRDNGDPIADYVAGVHAFGPLAAYLAVNISSPNTPGLRDLQAPDRLNTLLENVMAARSRMPCPPEIPGELAANEAGFPAGRTRLARAVPILVKLAPDLADDDIAPVMACLIHHRVDGVILTNTTLSREGVDTHRNEAGGLSGRPLFARSTRFLAKCFLLSEGKLPLIGVGGIDSGAAALAKIRAGASLVQLYTGLIFEGPALLSALKTAFLTEIEMSGKPLSALVGLEAERWASA